MSKDKSNKIKIKKFNNQKNPMNINKNDYLTEEEVAKKLKVSIYTLRRWYRWYNKEGKKRNNILYKVPRLPPKIKRGVFTYWLPEQLEQIIEFKEFYYNKGAGMMRDIDTIKRKTKQKRGFNKNKEFNYE